MIRGFYTALSGIIASLERQAIIADNVANVNTPGFKQARSTQLDFGLELARSTGGALGWVGTATLPAGLTIDPSGGPLEETGLPTDLAIEGDGLFTVRDGARIAYTRAGDFLVSADGTLVTQTGQPVLDTAGQPIRAGATFTVSPDGTVAETGQRLAIVGFVPALLVRRGGNLYAAAGPLPRIEGRVRQGALERSNVDLAEAMTELMTTQRLLGLSSRALALQDETLGEATQLGRLRT